MIVMENMALLLFGPDYYSISIDSGDKAYHIKEVMISFPLLMSFITSVIITVSLYCILRFTELGMAIRACSDNKKGAMIVGINVKNFYIIAFALGAACAGVAGPVITPFTYIYPTVGLSYLLLAFIVVVLGGMGNFMGAFWGGLIIGIAESMGALFMPGSLKEVLAYAIFIIVLFFRPSGLLVGSKS
jgi:branched-chain amino acid transport system permease protein